MSKELTALLSDLSVEDVARVLVFCLRSAAKAERERIPGDYAYRDFESADRHIAEANYLEERASYYERRYLYDDQDAF